MAETDFVVLGSSCVWARELYRADPAGVPECVKHNVLVSVEFHENSYWEPSGSRWDHAPSGQKKELVPIFSTWPVWKVNLRELAGDHGFAVRINADGTEQWLVGSRETLDTNDMAWVEGKKRHALEAFADADAQRLWSKGICNHHFFKKRWSGKKKLPAVCADCRQPIGEEGT